MLDERLISSINRGRCLAFIGSGPSCEVGYPSWEELARLTYEKLQSNGLATDIAAYKRFLRHRQYPELFKQAERDAGSRTALIQVVKDLLSPKNTGRRSIYEMLARWPFACYLTTNYDDEISHSLDAIGVHFTTKRNDVEDFYSIRDSMSHLIFKIHSDLQHPDGIVLTSDDYHYFLVSPTRQYFRDKLRFLLESFDVFIVGHSISDSDIRLILEIAKETASPKHPIYMLAADLTRAEEQELFDRYNIRVTSYENRDGSHSQLRRILAAADQFIVPRQMRSDIPVNPPSPEQNEAAVSLLVFRRLQDVRYDPEVAPAEYLGPLILTALSKTSGQFMSPESILTAEPLHTIARGHTNDFLPIIEGTLVILARQGYVINHDSNYAMSSKGVEAIAETHALRRTEEDTAYGQFLTDLKIRYGNLEPDQEQLGVSSLRNAIISVFEKRGLAIASTIFLSQGMEPDDFSSLFKAVVNASSVFSPDRELQVCFAEAARKFLVQPSETQRNYLRSVSQGYFLFHMVGLDPTCAKIRREIFRDTAWLCDSSVLLPLFAAGSHNHEYAVDLFQRLNSLEAYVFTTDKLLQEIWEHLQWARRRLQTMESDAIEFYRAALVKGSYKQNLFIDGFIRLAAEGRVASFDEYLTLICPSGCSEQNFAAEVEERNISIVSMKQLDGFEQEDWGDIQEIQGKIIRERESRATLRSELQTKAEAEVVQIITGLRNGTYSIARAKNSPEVYYFVSLSKILDQISTDMPLITWRPEALYRYLTALPGENVDPNLLQQAVLHEFFYAGVVFIDEYRYKRFFGHATNQSRLLYQEQKEKLQQQTETIYAPDYDDAFENTPDLEKPFFTSQLGWRIAERIEREKTMAEREAGKLRIEVRRLKQERDAAISSRRKRHADHEERRIRNLRDPKRQSKLKRRAKKRRQDRKK